MNTIDFLIDFHLDADRQGPGSNSSTIRALKAMKDLSFSNLKIVDIGCGTGASALVLANEIEGGIVAVDLFPAFLRRLQERAEALGLAKKITTLQADMNDLPFGDNEFDVIWSEGAIYNMGFENGIKSWLPFLKINGYVAITELSWITNDRPKEIEAYWTEQYGEIDTAENKVKVLERNGFEVVDHFILSKSCWMDNYYEPISKRMKAFLEKHNYAEMAQSLIQSEEKEIGLYKKYGDYYGYVFYIAKKHQ